MPSPGEWTEADYFPFSERGRLVELSDGNLEVLHPLNDFHQLILLRLAMWLQTFVSANRLGKVRFAPLPVRLWTGKIQYWIIDPVEKTIEIFEVRGNYESARLDAAPQSMTSPLFEGFSLSLADLFAEEE